MRGGQPGSLTVPNPMRLFLDICTGLGLSASAGIRPFLPAVVTGALAAGDVTIDFDGTDFAFIEGFWFLLVVLIAMFALVMIQRRYGAEAVESGPLGAAVAGIAIGMGALLFSASLADHTSTWWPGIPAGAAFALLGQLASRSLFERVRARAERAVKEALVVYQDVASLVGAVLAILLPPVSILLVGFLGWLLIGGRRRAGEKYAGLRILR
jgi:hypothetical protein